MKKLTKKEKHAQCLREIKGTFVVVLLCCLWHIISAFVLNGTGWRFLGMPAWFSVSVLGSIIIVHIGIFVLLRKVFVNFDYDGECAGDDKDE